MDSVVSSMLLCVCCLYCLCLFFGSVFEIIELLIWFLCCCCCTDVDLKNFVWELAREGFVLQLISLAGLHSNAAATAELAARFKTDGMLAYVQLVQRKEEEIGCDVLTHQKWSGANYVDRILASVSSGSSSTSAIGKDSTEHSF